MSTTVSETVNAVITLPPPDGYPRTGTIMPGEAMTFQGNITVKNDSLYPMDVSVRFDLNNGFQISASNNLGHALDFAVAMHSSHTLSVRNGLIEHGLPNVTIQGGARLLKSLASRV